ncbi:MAG: glycosyltransferase family 39 protein [Candidatus Omnitrophota bacterium]
MVKYEKKKYIFLLLAFLAAAFILRINNLSSRSLWADEFFTLFQSTGHGEVQKYLDTLSDFYPPKYFNPDFFKQMLHNDSAKTINDVTVGLIREDTHPPLYFWLMYFWMRLFGDGIFPVRFLSVLMGLFSVFLAYRVTRILFGGDAALFSALFISICPFAVVYSREARHYAFITALALASWLFVLRFERKKRNIDLLWATILNSLAMLTHYFYFFTFLGQLIYFTLIYRKDKDTLDKFYLSFFCSFLLLAPWFSLVMANGYNFFLASWPFGYFGFAGKVYYLLIAVSRYIFVFEPVGIIMRLLLLAGLFGLILWIRPILKNALSQYRRESLFCFIMFLVPLLIISVIDIIQHGVLLKQERFLTFPFIGLIPLAGYCFYYLFRKNKKIFIFCCLFLFIYSVVISANPQFGPASLGAAEWINRESKGYRTAVIMGNIRSVILTQAYYMNDDICIVPVTNGEQLREGVNVLSNSVDKIFIVRHFNRTDPELVDPGFIRIKEIGSGFKLTQSIEKDYIGVFEFTK